MINRLILAAAFLGLAMSVSQAHGPTPRQIEESVVISAEPAEIWAVIGDFHGLAGWHPMVASSEGTGENETGATRDMELEGGVVVDRLDRHDDEAMTYGYRLLKENVEALPVSFYSATLAVRETEGGAEVVWNGMFYRADTSNYPAEGMTDEAGREALSAFFRAGLDELKESLGGGS